MAEAIHVLEDGRVYQEMAGAVSPYGDGKSSQRTVGALVKG